MPPNKLGDGISIGTLLPFGMPSLEARMRKRMHCLKVGAVATLYVLVAVAAGLCVGLALKPPL